MELECTQRPGEGGRGRWEFSAGGDFGQTQGGSPCQGRGILDGGAGMGRGDVSFSNMGSRSLGGLPADPEVARSMAQFRSGPNPGSTSALTTLIPSPRSSAVASWEEVG